MAKNRNDWLKVSSKFNENFANIYLKYARSNFIGGSGPKKKKQVFQYAGTNGAKAF